MKEVPVKKFTFLLRPSFCWKYIKVFKNISRGAQLDQNDIKCMFCIKNGFLGLIIPLLKSNTI